MSAPVATTRSGAVRGTSAQGVSAFKGIPYAAPPVGPNRFMAPVAPEPWDGVRDAIGFSPIPPQPDLSARSLPSLDLRPLVPEQVRAGDDYLTVNVWTPDPSARGLPVMVYIFGGAFVSGASATLLYDGTRFARDGVVCVSFNYRLGVEGFLPLEGGVTNAGLRDQIAALTWVQENIATFGGDPANVTIFGESAGALNVANLLAVPQAQGLFARAISQSGGAQHTMSLMQARMVAARMSDLLGAPATRESFAALSPEQIITAQMQMLPGSMDLTTAEDPDPTGGLTLFLPVRDGDLLVAQPVTSIRQGAGATVDLLLGTNSDEMNFYFVPTGVSDAIPSDEQVAAMIEGRHPDPARLVAAYRASRPQASPGQLLSAIMTDWMFHIPSIRLAEAHAPHSGGTYVYEFAWRSPTCDGLLGACHGLELGFVFDNLDAPGLVGPLGMVGEHPPANLAQRMHRAWIDFATTGRPGWAPYTAEQHNVMRIDSTWDLVTDPHSAERVAWEGARRDTPRQAVAETQSQSPTDVPPAVPPPAPAPPASSATSANVARRAPAGKKFWQFWQR